MSPQPRTGDKLPKDGCFRDRRVRPGRAQRPLLVACHPSSDSQTPRLPPTQHTGLPWQLQARAGSRRPLSSSSRFSSCHTPVPTLGHSRTDPAAHALSRLKASVDLRHKHRGRCVAPRGHTRVESPALFPQGHRYGHSWGLGGTLSSFRSLSPCWWVIRGSSVRVLSF